MAGQRLTTAEFMSQVKAIHRDAYDYANTVYINSRSKVIIKCIKCNTEFEQKATNHLQGQGCPICNKKNTKLTQEEFVTRCINIHGTTYDYSKVNLINLRSKIDIGCNICNMTFSQRAKTHLDGSGCPKCNNHSFRYDLPATMYYVKLNAGEAYKIGITNSTVKRRFSADSLIKVDIIKEWQYATGKEAYIAEQKILREFNMYRHNLSILINGNTELFNKDVLKLDNS